MYNRYIPQPDGSYRRNRMQEVVAVPEKQVPAQPATPVSPPEPLPPQCSSCAHHTAPRRPALPPRDIRRREATGVSNFLKQLLPKEFEVEDLLVVLLLLLMSGDCQENQNNALLTLVLYLFL